MRLNGTGLAVVALGHVENDRVGMQLWRDIAIDRAGRIVLKLGGNKLARGFRRMIAANAGLRVPFELVKGNADAIPVGFAHTLVATDQRRKRNGFGRRKSRVPPGAMFHRFDGLAVGVLIFIRRSLAHKLLAGLRMLALTEFREILGGNGPGKAELRGQAALPLACNDAALRPVVLLLGGEFLLVVGLGLACGKRF